MQINKFLIESALFLIKMHNLSKNLFTLHR